MMSESAALLLPPQGALQVRVSVLSGPGKGTAYRVVGQVATLGRGRENNIVIKDKKISRTQLCIKFSDRRIYLENLSEKNPFIYNGSKINYLIVVKKETIRVGNTTLKFELVAPVGGQGLQSPTLRSRQLLQKKNPSPLFLGIISIMILVMLYLFLFKDSEEALVLKDEVSIRRPQAIEKMKKELKENKKTSRYNRAQAKYISGFRAYQNRQFKISSAFFQSCLAIDPTHPLCGKYLNLSSAHFDKLIQEYLRNGQKYLELRQYSRCVASLKNVVYMVQDTSDENHREAERGLEICIPKKANRF